MHLHKSNSSSRIKLNYIPPVGSREVREEHGFRAREMLKRYYYTHETHHRQLLQRQWDLEPPRSSVKRVIIIIGAQNGEGSNDDNCCQRQ